MTQKFLQLNQDRTLIIDPEAQREKFKAKMQEHPANKWKILVF